jgi:sRNA-binding protein
MTRFRFGMALALTGLLLTAATASADIKTTEKTQMKFEGMIGRMMGMFGGKAMKEGVVNTVAVKGDRKITSTEDSARIVDLAEEKVYELNLRDKTYKVVTFAELKKQMEEARAKAEEEARKQKGRDEKKDPSQKEMEVEFQAKNTGEKRDISGFNCRQVILTIAVHEKGKTLDDAGGMLMTTDMWLAPKVPGMREIVDFELRYAKKLAENMVPSAEQLAQAFAMYPGLKDAMVKMQAERVNMDGTPIESIMTVQTVQTKEQAAEAKKQDQGGSSSSGGAIGGMLGRFGKKKEEPKPAEGAPAKATADSDTKVTFMTSTVTVLSVSPTVSADDVAVPAGFKLRK